MKRSLNIRFILMGWLLSIILYSSLVSIQAQNIELDKQIGAENAKMVEMSTGLVANDKLTSFINQVGQRLVNELEDKKFDYSFHVVNDPIPNAFAFPGGYIFVTRGILSIITTEDELAGILGHEIIHAHNRHGIKQMKKTIMPRLLELPGELVGNVFGKSVGETLNKPLKMSNEMFLAKYSRKHESESDVEGIKLAAKAGYNPYALQAQLTRLSASFEILTNEKEKDSYFNDHPYTPNRVKLINETACTIKWTKREPESANFPEPLEGLLFGNDPAKGVIKDSLFMHPELDFEMIFPSGWIVNNEPQGVSAIKADRQSAIVLGIPSFEGTAQELALSFKNEVEEQYGIKDIELSTINLNGEQGQLLSMEDRDSYMFVVFIQLGARVYQLSGVAPIADVPLLEKSLYSFKTLTTKNRKTIEQLVIKTNSLKKGESIEAFTHKSKSYLSPDLLAFINGIESTNQTFENDRIIKVIVAEKY